MSSTRDKGFPITRHHGSSSSTFHQSADAASPTQTAYGQFNYQLNVLEVWFWRITAIAFWIQTVLL